MRQRARMGVDVDQRRLIGAGERLAGDGVYAVHDRVFIRNADFHLFGTVGRGLSQLLRRAAGAQASGGDVKGVRSGDGGDRHQHGEHACGEQAKGFVHVFFLLVFFLLWNFACRSLRVKQAVLPEETACCQWVSSVVSNGVSISLYD